MAPWVEGTVQEVRLHVVVKLLPLLNLLLEGVPLIDSRPADRLLPALLGRALLFLARSFSFSAGAGQRLSSAFMALREEETVRHLRNTARGSTLMKASPALYSKQ